jgi:iron(III) transport system substrate-binding protein
MSCFIRKSAMRFCEVAVLAGLSLAAAGCWSRSEPGVVVYAALDAEFSQPILEDFTRETGVAVRTKFDLESTKTVGLTNLVMAEARNPRADVFWNNEILNTLRLEKKGLLDTYRSPAAKSYPELFRSPNGAWHGFAARARVLLVNTEVVVKEDFPDSIHDLADSRWRGKTGMAKPLFGTTATHAACLFAALGDQPAKAFFRTLKENDIQILSGNKQVALAVASGQLAFGITDTDDAIIELEHGHPVAIVYPDREQDQLGTLFIPNTLAIIKGGPHPQQARRLVDYLLQPSVEAKLAKGASAQIPLNADAKSEVRIETPRTVKAMAVDFEAAAEKWDAAAEFLRDEFTGAR